MTASFREAVPVDVIAGHDSTANEPANRRLRVALLLDDLSVPSWIDASAANIQQSPHLELAAIAINRRPHRATRSAFEPSLNPFRLARFYAYADRWLFRASPDAQVPVNVMEHVASPTIVDVEPVFRERVFGFDEPDRTKLLACDLDVMLLFWAGVPDETTARLARYGVWYLHDHQRALNGGAPLGFWEVLNQERVTIQHLQARDAKLLRSVTLGRHYGPTHARSIALSQNNLLWKVPLILTAKLEQLWRARSIDAVREDRLIRSESRFTRGASPDPVDDSGEPAPSPMTWSNVTTFKAIASHVGRSVRARFENRRAVEQWVMGYLYSDDVDVRDFPIDRIRWLLPPRDRFWADPFPVQTETGDFLFFEEFIESRGKGHLCVAPFGSGGFTTDPEIILDCEYHLSYPFVFRWRGDWFLVPETQDAGRIDLYRFDAFPYRLRYCQTLLSNVRACDATLFEANGRWWMFAAIASDGSWNVDELFLFHADTPMGPWIPHERNPIKSDVRSSRPAGAVFVRNGKRYRPAQDCSYRYGHSIRFFEIVELSPTTYREVEVGTLEPLWSPEFKAIHTVNRSGTLFAVDAKKVHKA